MDNRVIKSMLQQKKRRVYTLIVELYYDKLAKYKPHVFRIWLANELRITEEEINVGSLAQAMQRFKRKRVPLAASVKEFGA
jgi:hypothetical protein